jgi:hypothetical protein
VYISEIIRNAEHNLHATLLDRYFTATFRALNNPRNYNQNNGICCQSTNINKELDKILLVLFTHTVVNPAKEILLNLLVPLF